MNRCVLAASLFALVALLSGCGVKQALHTAALEALAEAQGDAARLKEELKAEQAATDSAARDQARSEDEATAQSVLDQLRVPLEQPLAAGRLELRLREGRPVIDLPQDLLFASGHLELGEIGRDTIASVAAAFTQLPEASFEVTAHSDQEPDGGSGQEDSWALTTARAASVVRELVGGGIGPERLSATGLGAHRPRADNRSAEGRALNRRIEIQVQISP